MEAQLLKWKQVTSYQYYQYDEPSHREALTPTWLEIVQLGPNGSTALAVKAIHFLPTWCPQPDLMEAQLLQAKQVTSCQHDEPSHKEPLEPVWLAIVQLGPHGSTALEVKASHFISILSIWWAKPQRSPDTNLVGNSAAWTQWKHGSCSESHSLLTNMMSTAWPNGSTALAGEASHFLSTRWAKPQGTSGTSLVGNSAAWA